MTFSPCSILDFTTAPTDAIFVWIPTLSRSRLMDRSWHSTRAFAGSTRRGVALLQTGSFRIEMPPANVEARVVRGTRRLAAMALCHAKRAVHSQHELHFVAARRWHGDVPVLLIAERLALARQVINAMADDERAERIDRRLGLGAEAFGHHLGASRRVPVVEIIEGTAEVVYGAMRRVPTDERQHAFQLVEADAKRCCRQDQDTAGVLLLPPQLAAELGVLAFGSMRLVDDQQIAVQIGLQRGVGVLDDLN
ncbi:MAG TPA: hypothetical protein VMV69_12945 [Pirellulales bacterium]|nr:hypothetical protein [Pirellulales bacterium]